MHGAGSWKGFLEFSEEHAEDDAAEHRECLDALKAGIREGLKSALGPHGGAGDAALALELIERILQGQTCSFGNHIFGVRQACIVLIHLLKLLPEPRFEAAAPALVRVAAQLVAQLGKQDSSLLRSFASDCAGALAAARERPVKAHAFPKFVQRCKVDMAGGGSFSRGGTSQGQPGLPLELQGAGRLRCFCERLLGLATLAMQELAPFLPPGAVEALLSEALGLVADVVGWAEPASFDGAEAAHIVAACLTTLQQLLAPPTHGARLSLRGASLHLHAQAVETLPCVAPFALRECGEPARAALAELTLRLVLECDQAVVFPHLGDLLKPLRPQSGVPVTEATLAHLRVFVAAAARFGGGAAAAEELWRACCGARQRPEGAQGASLPELLAEPAAHRLLAPLVRHLGAHEAACSLALDLCGAASAGAAGAGASSAVAGRRDLATPVLALCMAVRALPATEVQAAAGGGACASACRRFVSEARRMLCDKLEEDEVRARTLQVMLEALVAQRVLLGRLRLDNAHALVERLLRPAFQCRRASAWWPVFNLVLEAFVVHSEAQLCEKLQLLQKIVARPASGAGTLPHVEAAAWAAVGHALAWHLEKRAPRGGGEKSSTGAPAWETVVDPSGLEKAVHREVLGLALRALSDSGATHPAVLAAIAYVLPLLITSSYLIPGLCAQGHRDRMPRLLHAFATGSPYSDAEALASMGSPTMSVPNPLKASVAFAAAPDVSGKEEPSAADAQEWTPLPASCPFCNSSAVGSAAPPRRLCADAGAPWQLSSTTGCSWLGRPCACCAMDTLQLDWRPFGGGMAGGSLRLPQAWGQLRQRGGSCWLQATRELLDACSRLCRALPGAPAGGGALSLLEPGDTQQDAVAGRAGRAGGGSGATDGGAAPGGASCLAQLVHLGLFGACAAASRQQLQELAPSVTELLRQVLPQRGRYHGWESGGLPCALLALVECCDFVDALLPPEMPGGQQRRDDRLRATRATQERCHRWRLDVLGGVELKFQSADGVCPDVAAWPPLPFRAVSSGAPPATVSAALASLVAACVAVGPTQRKAATLRLQQLWAFSMIAPFGVEDVLRTQQGDAYIRLFETYSRRNFRVESICQLVLRGSLKLQVRSQLPKILPALVLTQSMQTIEDLCALLEESVQSLFTPQLPYILSAMAQQPMESMAGAFKFISERVYSRQMSITSICDASLGQVLVLILWSSVSPEGHVESRKRCFYAVNNIVGALQARHASSGVVCAEAAAAARPPLGAPPLQRGSKRKTIDSISSGGATGAAGAPPRKRRPGRAANGEAIAVPIDDAASPEVMQTLEDSFLHVLDILEIVLSGNQHSPKWEEYSPLLCDPHCEEHQLDHGRLLAAIALLFELVPESLHRFAPKVLEFLHSAAELSSFHPEGARCWQLFVQHVGVARLRLLLPAVVVELMRLARHLRPRASEGCNQLCESLLCSVVQQTCQQQPDLVASLPPLPDWPELQSARAAINGMQPAPQGSGHQVFDKRLEAGVEQLESATQQAVKRAALEHIGDLVESQRWSSPARVTQLNTALLSRLMRALLQFLWESSAWPGDQLKCGRVLGTLGAIDPSRFSQLDLGNTQLARTPQDLGNVDLLAKRVLADFLVPNLTSKNSYAFAAQEILKYLHGRGRCSTVLDGLSEDVRETLRPYMHSSYQLVDPAQVFEDTSTFDGVVAQAVGLVQGEQGAFFQACLPAAHGNHALALFLMHHILHNLLDSRTAVDKLEGLASSLASLLDSPKDATAQAVFSLVDDLIQRREKLFLNTGLDRAQPGDAGARERALQRIQAMQEPMTHRRVVAASVRCGAHARALQFLEQAIIEEYQGPGTVFDSARIESEQDCLLLHSIYRDLDEQDGALGALRAGPTTAKTRTLRLEQEGRWQDVQSLYEVQLASTVHEGEARRDLLCRLAHCPHNMRRFESSLRLVEGMEAEDSQGRLRPLAVEAAWQLCSWDRLERALERPSARDSDDFQVQLGQALLEFHRKDADGLEGVLRDTALQVTRSVASAARESYTRAYQHLVKLHVISDLSWLASKRADSFTSVGTAAPARALPRPGELADKLLERAEVVVPTFSTRQLVLSPLRAALEDMGLAEDSKRVELAVVRLCRKNGVPVAMEHPAVSFGAPGITQDTLARAQLEWGRLLYARGSRHDALRHMQQLAPKNPRARLLGTRWATEPASELLIPRVAEAEFKLARDCLPNDEAAWFYHASYLDQLLKEQLAKRNGTPGPQSTAPSAFDMKNLITFTFRGYLQTLRRGNKRLHFILNRLLQLTWDICEEDVHKAEALKELESATTGENALEPWMWYLVLPQLISRLYNQHMRSLFKRLISNVLATYPHQAGWQILQLHKSKSADTKSLGQDLLLDLTRSHPDVHRVLIAYSRLIDILISLAAYAPKDPNEFKISLDRVSGFSKLLGSGSSRTQTDNWHVLVPLQSQMTEAIPGIRLHGKYMVSSSPFGEPIFSERCHNIVDVFRTKEKPKKVTFVGQDGKSYPFLCKSEKRGDLRKDSRLMEFGVMVNQLLRKNPDTRRRNLEVRTFNVVILKEDCGLIEWVPNTKGMRNIIEDLWKQLKPGMMQNIREVKEMFDTSRNRFETFTKQVLPRHPPILYKWFSLNADPSVWLAKRLLFSRTQALWSMLGYIVGLGDRHGENILVDQETGRMVHVDFDCLFGKGMGLECPETVPFRLTQNCVAAMGVTGVEGVFRNCCELVMGVLRERANRQTLLSVLHVFIADPLIEWQRARPQRQDPSRPQDDKQGRIQEARTTIGEVERKLNGMLNVGAVVDLGTANQSESVLTPEERGKNSACGLLGRDRGVGLSIAGQVDELLKAAMCKRNLSEMYVGWQPWQ